MYINLKIQRTLSNETITEVAKHLGICRQVYSNKENGVSDFTISEIRKLIKKYDKSFEYLFEGLEEVS